MSQISQLFKPFCLHRDCREPVQRRATTMQDTISYWLYHKMHINYKGHLNGKEDDSPFYGNAIMSRLSNKPSNGWVSPWRSGVIYDLRSVWGQILNRRIWQLVSLCNSINIVPESWLDLVFKFVPFQYKHCDEFHQSIKDCLEILTGNILIYEVKGLTSSTLKQFLTEQNLCFQRIVTPILQWLVTLAIGILLSFLFLRKMTLIISHHASHMINIRITVFGRIFVRIMRKDINDFSAAF